MFIVAVGLITRRRWAFVPGAYLQTLKNSETGSVIAYPGVVSAGREENWQFGPSGRIAGGRKSRYRFHATASRRKGDARVTPRVNENCHGVMEKWSF